jgi:glycine/D-amino acid oxidase-like deaminating enzyme
MTTEDGKKNIVIIGGGIIGCTSAYYLTRHPSFDRSKHSITLLEASSIAGGASGKAGGLLGLWAYPTSIVPLSYRLHKELADEHGGADRWGYRAVHVAQVDCIGKKPEKKTSNGINTTTTTTKDEDISLQKRSKEALGKLRAAGVPKELDWVDADSLRFYDEMGTPATTAQVHPFQFTTAMAELARAAGVDIRTHAPVDKINYSADGKRVESVSYTDKSPESSPHNEQTTLPTTDVVLAAGPWTKRLLPSAPIEALRAHSVTIRPSRPVSAYCLFTEIKLPGNGTKRSETVTPEIYARPNNEVYACGEGDRLVPLPLLSSEVAVDEAKCDEIAAHVGAVSRELRDGEITARQACYLPNVASGGSSGPLIGLTGTKGLVLAAGHTCWGIQNGPATGKLVSEFVFEGKAGSAKVGGLDPRLCL